MSIQACCRFKITGWEEKRYQEFVGGARLTRAKVLQVYQGDISGEGTIEFLMAYSTADKASFVGLELVKGKVADKPGSFVIQHIGSYDSDGAHSTWSIVDGSGTGELLGITGKGSYLAVGESVLVTFSYDLPGKPLPKV
ncbi:MAG: DUF3224 domain-containing protein [Gammaproteobacteria bacterium]|nr:DUF3224 domain-containing protein [Gammaproteobacteria bacterium]